MPRLEEWVAFCNVVEQKSFSRAAELLGLTQPAVSFQVKALETEYGVTLLHRDGYEIVPTESGQVVYDFACQIINLYEQSRQHVQELDDSQVSGKLRIGASTGPGEYLLPLLLGQFKQQYPQVKIALRVGDSNEIIDQILKYQLQLGFVGTSRRDRYLSFEPFIEDELILVVHPEHPWAQRSSITHEDLCKAPLILQQYGSGATAFLYEALASYDIDINRLNIIMELGLQESTKTAVRAGLGVTIISKLGVMDELARKVLVQVPIDGIELRRDFYAVYRRASPLNKLEQTFLKFALETVGDTTRQRKPTNEFWYKKRV